MTEFYKGLNAPKKILELLSSKLGKKSGYTNYEMAIDINLLLKAWYLTNRLLKVGKHRFSSFELEKGCYLLNHFILLLDIREPDKVELGDFLSELNNYMQIILEPMLSIDEMNAPINHYLQNENLSTLNFEELTGY